VDMTPEPEGISDSHPCNVSLHVGNSANTSATSRDHCLSPVATRPEWKLYDASFPDMHLVPKAPYNIFSPSEWRMDGS
jgi:hypothetical protein